MVVLTKLSQKLTPFHYNLSGTNTRKENVEIPGSSIAMRSFAKAFVINSNSISFWHMYTIGLVGGVWTQNAQTNSTLKHAITVKL